MKLTYSNWHKELVHDDSIQSELSTMTKGQLEFNNRPFVKHRTDSHMDRDDFAGTGRNQFRKNFGSRDNRGGGNRGGGRDNRGGNGGRDNNRNFKKRY